VSRQDFSFLAPALSIAGMGVLALLFGGMIFGFSFGSALTDELRVQLTGESSRSDEG